MFLNRFRAIVVLAGVIAFTGLLAARFAITGMPPSPGIIASGVFACATAVLLLALFQGPPAATIAQVLYDAEQGGTSARGGVKSKTE